MRILYFGAYDSSYSRNLVILKGLRENGIEIIECNESGSNIFKLLKLLFRHLSGNYKYDIMFVPFPGQEVMLLARLLTRKPIVFDAFTSHYEGYVLDRGKYKPESINAYWYYWLDAISCRLADMILLDTDAHIDFFVDTFKLPRSKFRKLYVGTDSGVMKPFNIERKTNIFTVHFHGTYIPLQGVEYIIKAADILRDEPIIFNLIGRGQTFSNNKHLADSLDLSNINFIEKVLYSELPRYMNASDICLGIFGHTSKTSVVIPNKVFEALACARPIITARTKAITELFQDQENILLCQPVNPKDLAEKILLLKNNKRLRDEIAIGGFEIFKNKLTEHHLGATLTSYIKGII